MIQKECLFHTECQTQEELFAKATQFLVAKGYVSEAFQKALEEREKEFPTGLPTTPAVAIPHTDGTYVKKDGILCIVNKHRLKFNEMGGDEDDLVYPQVIFLLVIKGGDKHLGQLQRLVETIQEGELTSQALRATDIIQFERVVNQYL